MAIAARLSRHPNRSLRRAKIAAAHDQDEAPSGIKNLSQPHGQFYVAEPAFACGLQFLRSPLSRRRNPPRGAAHHLIAENVLAAS